MKPEELQIRLLEHNCRTSIILKELLDTRKKLSRLTNQSSRNNVKGSSRDNNPMLQQQCLDAGARKVFVKPCSVQGMTAIAAEILSASQVPSVRK